MYSDWAIRVGELGKCYHIYRQPRDRLMQMLMLGRKRYYTELWALRNVSFTVGVGETIGIIGRNGSGKSTLLHMICGTVNPTQGSVHVNGRTAALLELGAGFNPEFTGRENIYMSAALYGLRREEIDERYDEIVAFADVGEFINQPVKIYSSGMFVRLGFSVIAHVDADILIVDEALAVGDAVFVQKCMRFLRKFKEQGTLLFVSHDMGSVLNFCDKAIWLHEGSIMQVGAAKEVAECYLQNTLQEDYGNEYNLLPIEAVKNHDQLEYESICDFDEKLKPVIDYNAKMEVHDNLSASGGWVTGGGEIISVRFNKISNGNKEAIVLAGGEMVHLVIKAVTNKSMDQPILGFIVRDRLGQDLFGENTLSFTEKSPRSFKAGTIIEAEFRFRLPMLQNGQYSVMVSFAEGDLFKHVQHHWLHDALILNVASSRVRWGMVGVHFDNVCLREA